MKSKFKLAIALVAGAAIGGAAVQGLHAQAKPKAYRVSESEVLDAAATTAYNHRRCGDGSQACEYQRVGQPGAGAGMAKLGSEEESRTAAR
jgi:hypothetical protein